MRVTRFASTIPLLVAAVFSPSLACDGAASVGVDGAPVGDGAVGGYRMPSVDDERATYQRWGWTWTASAEPAAVSEPIADYYATAIDVHYDSEGDDLWSYLMMYRRTGNPVYLGRAEAWARYFKEEYRTSGDFDFDGGFLYDHMYGWGLIAWYEHTCEQGLCDAPALAEAENLGAVSETHWNEIDPWGVPRYVPGEYSMATYGLRRGARHLLLATRLAEVTQAPRWLALRDKLIDLWLLSPDWDARGFYLMTSEPAYQDQGIFVTHSFHQGILSEAFDQAFRSTGRIELRGRMVAMARFVSAYGLDAYYQYTGKLFGLRPDGTPWHSYSDGCGTGCTYWDPVYTTSLVNTLVRGYKLSGDCALYLRAKEFFNRGTKGIYGEPFARDAADTEVTHFVDTRFAHQFWLDYNKGELQYTYLMFEEALSCW